MFKKNIISMVAVWFFLVLGSFGLLYTYSPAAKKTYDKLVKDRIRVKNELLQTKTPHAQQTRYQVSKQILYQKEGQRLQTRLAGNFSDIIYSKKDGEIVECFKDLTCTMQDKLMKDSNSTKNSSMDANEQVIRQFKAKEAIYSYKNGQLEAEDVEVAHYLVHGQLWPDSFDPLRPLLQGWAHSIRLSLLEDPSLKAQGFRAIFHDWGEE